jgi:hypothetical protein
MFYLDKTNLNKYLSFFKIAKKLNFYIIADIGPEVFKSLIEDNKFELFKK